LAAKKKKKAISNEREHANMKIVTSDVCAKCMKCERGRRYLEKMSKPGAIGKGVPCMLTIQKKAR